VSARFWSKVDKSGDCWIWTGARDGKGYERYAAGGVLQRELAAEFGVTTNHVWMLVNGKRGQR